MGTTVTTKEEFLPKPKPMIGSSSSISRGSGRGSCVGTQLKRRRGLPRLPFNKEKGLGCTKCRLAANGCKRCGYYEGDQPVPHRPVVKKKKKKKKEKETKRGVKGIEEVSPFEAARRRVLTQIAKIRKEQWLLETYLMDGWRGASKDKLKPKEELERAETAIARAKISIQEQIRIIDEAEGDVAIPQSAYTESGELPQESIFCGKCLSGEAHEDNDIILCDGFCGRAYHMKCLKPPLKLEDIPPDDEGWLCPACAARCDCIFFINGCFNTSIALDTPWQHIYQEAQGEESELENGENGENGRVKRERESDQVMNFLDLNLPSDDESEDEDFKGDSQSESSSGTINSSESSEEVEILDGKRRRNRVDYKKLNDMLFGEAEAYEGEMVSDGEWDPTREPKKVTGAKGNSSRRDGSSSIVRKKFGPDAVEKLRSVFRETDTPPMERRLALASELNLTNTQVNMWFASERHKVKKQKAAAKEEEEKQQQQQPQRILDGAL